eukprot:10562253-Alexandrium_andersonii.AAC.1
MEHRWCPLPRRKVAPVLLLSGIVLEARGALEQGPSLLDAIHVVDRVCHSRAVISKEGERGCGEV